MRWAYRTVPTTRRAYSMIYRYEAAIAQRFRDMFPETPIDTMAYAESADVLPTMAQVVKYPALYFHRETTQWQYNKLLPIREGNRAMVFVPFEQHYTAYILLESYDACFRAATRVRMYWHNHPHIMVQWPTAQSEPLPVQVRLAGINVSEVRPEQSDKGAQRMVEVQWVSHLFMAEQQETYMGAPIRTVERVNIYIDNSKAEVHTLSGELIESLPNTSVNNTI